jgi:hypothetical protein
MLNPHQYARCARSIVDALQLQSGEHVLIKLDPRVFAPLVEPLQKAIRAKAAMISGVVLAEDTREESEEELTVLRKLFNAADVFIWLPELNQSNRPALAKALVEWLDARRGRAVHFHWGSGSYAIPQWPLPSQDFIDALYLQALEVNPSELDRQHRSAMQFLRSGRVRVTTPEGTDFSFVVGDRPFCSQIGDASRARMASAQTRIDRDVELPAGVLRVAPLETSANGTIFLPSWQPAFVRGYNLTLYFRNGCLDELTGQNGTAILEELNAAGGAARMFREFAVGFNPALKIQKDHPFIAYYGYGSGVVRLSLGDNEEMGGANRGGGVYWNFIHNATVIAADTVIVQGGELTAAVDIVG